MERGQYVHTSFTRFVYSNLLCYISVLTIQIGLHNVFMFNNINLFIIGLVAFDIYILMPAKNEIYMQ